MVVVQLQAGMWNGLGYTYAHRTAALVARELVEKHCVGKDVMATAELFVDMRRSQRNYGSGGIGATALSAVRGPGVIGKLHIRSEPANLVLQNSTRCSTTAGCQKARSVAPHAV